MNTFVIAEAGANHNRNYEQALSLIDIAKNSGANAVKFQTYSSETLYAKNTPDFAGYKNINKLIKDIELPREWQKDLKVYSDKVGIEFMSTPFDEKAVEELVDLGVQRLKISGFESTDFRFVEMVASAKLPLIISIGIGFPINYMGKILDIAEKYGNELSLLHCQNSYPTPVSEIDLGVIQTLKHFRNVKHAGLSDHTTSINVPAFAVAAGASIIEKHYTISRTLDGPDHKFALEPNELSSMISLIKEAEQAMIKNPYGLYAGCEKPFMNAMRSVVSTRKIFKGEKLTTENTTTKRPYFDGYIPAMNYEDTLNKTVNIDIEEDTAIKITDL